MCDCITTARDKLHENIQPHHCLYFTNTCTNMTSGISKFTLQVEYDRMDSRGKVRNKRTFVAANYCPICGEPYEAQPLRGENDGE